MLVTTTPSVEGQKITRYMGLVTSEAILGANIFKDIFASITDIVGGRSGTYEKELRLAKDTAVAEMIQNAKQMGGNAIVGVDLDFETISGGSGNMLMVAASGTAVVLDR